MHVNDPRVTRLPEAVRQVMSDASTLVVETFVDESARRLIANMMRLNDGDSLSNYVAPELIHSLNAHFIGKPLFTESLMRMKPWAAMMLINLPDKHSSASSALTMDRLIESEFHLAQKPVKYLETAAEQLLAFDSLTLADQLTLFEQSVAALPEKPDKLERMYQLYLAGDLSGLLAVSQKQARQANGGAFRNLMQNLLQTRNSRMLDRMQKHIDHGNALVSVGALHLPGADGLLALLQRSGYKISAIGISD